MTQTPDDLLARRNELHDKLGIVIDEVSPTRTTGRVPVEGNTQPYGILHGGVSCLLAESLASIAAMAEVGPGGVASGIDLNATHHYPARSGWVFGEARALRIGGTIGTWEVILTDEADNRLCTARVSVYLKRPTRR